MASAESKLEINENSKYFLLILGYIHLECINFDSDMFADGVTIPSKCIDRVLKFYRHRFSVYAIGMNKYEEFGDVNMNIRKSHILHNVNIRGFQKCDEFSNLLSSPIDECIYYGRHKFMIRQQSSNQIYVAGHNNLGQCGVNSRELEVDEFTVLHIPHHESNSYDICCLSNGICAKHSFIVIRHRHSLNYRIYAFGTNKDGQFGTDSKFTQPQIYPLELSHLSEYLFVDLQLTIIQICCGEKHSIFLSKSGKLLGCGLNDKGQCGIEYDEDYEYILEPEFIEFHHRHEHVHSEPDEQKDQSVRIAHISCGREHTLCLDVDGKVWAFGVNTNGELGIGHNKDTFEWIDQPICINHTFIEWNSAKQSVSLQQSVTTNKAVKHNKKKIKNQHHHHSHHKNQHKKRGKNNSHHHGNQPQHGQTQKRNSKGHVHNEKASTSSSSSASASSELEIVSISAGERHSLFIDNKCGLWLCGSNWYCQIGNELKSFTECQKEPFLIQSMALFRDILVADASCGDYHTVMLDSHNNVYTFGANDSYQCHPPMFNGSDLHKIRVPLKIDRRNINIGPHDIITKVLGAASATILIVE